MTGRKNQPSVSSDHFGRRLSTWRLSRRESQLGLATSASISQRHLSFIETGRSQPSREMVFRLCDALDVPLRGRNVLLMAAGYAPAYSERPLAAAEMEGVREALIGVIGHHDPYPAFVLDHAWQIVLSNNSASRLVRACVDEATLQSLSPDGKLNFMNLMFEPIQMRPRILNWKQVMPRLLARLRIEAKGDPLSPSATLLAEYEPRNHRPAGSDVHGSIDLPIVPLQLRIGDAVLNLFNTVTTLGTPLDVGLQELRIDMSYPMDGETRAFLARVG